jgi:hypothetical protein
LVVCVLLATLDAFIRRRFRAFIVAALLLSLLRPEGGALAVIACAMYALREGVDARAQRLPIGVRKLAWLLLPALALGVQPLVNTLITGSAVASGNQAKSLLSMIAPMSEIVRRIFNNFTAMWRGFFFNDTEPIYTALAIALLALLWLVLGQWRASRFAERRWNTALIFMWLLAGSAAISTLDTAFWHFKRYQIPLLALLFPLAGWGAAWLIHTLRRLPKPAQSLARYGIALTCVVSAAGTWIPFIGYYALNVGYVRAQPYALAAWLHANTAPNARVAVHDVGMMRYMGGRTTLDMVGLTTAGAADSWRNGPGSVGEWLLEQRPDYIASYGVGHGLGLGYLEATDLYAEPLVRYPVQLDPQFNVALAADVQGVYAQNYASAEAGAVSRQVSVVRYLDGFALVDTLNVASRSDEIAHNYAWVNARPPNGFPTEFNQFNALDCPSECSIMGGGRRINGEETFTLRTTPNQDALLVSRVHSVAAGELDVYANAERVGTRVLPPLAGSWLELATHIPARLVTADTVDIRIVPRVAHDDYMPYVHWWYQGEWQPTMQSQSRDQAVYQQGAFSLIDTSIALEGEQLIVDVAWRTAGMAQGDYNVFVHVYAAGDRERVLAQVDRRPMNGTLPPGNWLAGVIEDQFVVNFADVQMPRQIEIAIGFYDPLTFARLQPIFTDDAPTTYSLLDDGRLFIGGVELRRDG